MKQRNAETIRRREAARRRYSREKREAAKVNGQNIACPIADACAKIERVLEDAQLILIPALPVDVEERVKLGRLLLSAFVRAASLIDEALETPRRIQERQCNAVN